MSASSLNSILSASPTALAFRQEASARRVGEQPTQSPTTITRERDSVELSSQAQRLSQRGSDAPVRLDLVTRVRAQIEAGTYETPAKLQIAELKLRRDVRNYTA